jgi:ParB/RepB/Spo0J family partition protein
MAHSQPVTREIEINLIDVGDQQIRETPEDESIGELAESIASKGLLQPVGVTPIAGDRYQLRWGHRRLLAHQRLGKAKIRATIYDGDEKSLKGLALVENLHRTQMTMRDEVEAVGYLNESEGKSVEQIATILNKGRSWVLNRLMIPTLPEFLSEPLLAGDLPVSHVEIISKVPDEGARRYLAAQCVVQKWNSSSLKIIAECYMHPTDPETPPNGTKGIAPTRNDFAPFLYTCEMCGEKGTLDQFTLVRIHKDGYACRTVANRPDNESGAVDGLERHIDDDGRTDNQGTDRKDQASIIHRETQGTDPTR